MSSISSGSIVHLESTDGGGHRRNRRARLGSIVITLSGKVGAWSGRRWIRVGLGLSTSVRLGCQWSLKAGAGGCVVVPVVGAGAGGSRRRRRELSWSFIMVRPASWQSSTEQDLEVYKKSQESAREETTRLQATAGYV